MTQLRQITIELPEDMIEIMHERIALGQFASESDMVRQGLIALDTQETEVEHWFHQQVAPAYDAYKTGMTRTSGISEAMLRLDAEMDRIDKESA
jgi:antitoxin ParD1/3/4